jgi:hypothetical protein
LSRQEKKAKEGDRETQSFGFPLPVRKKREAKETRFAQTTFASNPLFPSANGCVSSGKKAGANTRCRFWLEAVTGEASEMPNSNAIMRFGEPKYIGLTNE